MEGESEAREARLRIAFLVLDIGIVAMAAGLFLETYGLAILGLVLGVIAFLIASIRWENLFP